MLEYNVMYSSYPWENYLQNYNAIKHVLIQQRYTLCLKHKCSELGMTRANDVKENEKNAGFVLLEASQSKAGAESLRLYESSRQVLSVWKYKYIPEIVDRKKPHKEPPSLKHALSNPGPKSLNRLTD